MKTRRFGAACFVLATWMALGVAHADRAPKSQFPTPEKLENLKKDAPLPTDLFDRPVATVESWEFEGPFPDVVGAVSYRDPSDWGALLEVAAARRAGLVVATEAMHCAAREWGRFHLEHDAPPDFLLQSYIGERCSSVAPSISFRHFKGGLPANASEAEVFDAWRPAIEKILQDKVVAGPHTAGIWFGSKDGKGIVVVAFGERRVRVDAVPTVFEEGDGTFIVSGELLVPAESIAALVNVGEFDSRYCERSPQVLLPRFAFRCQVDREDAISRFTMSVTPPGALLGNAALSTLLWPSGKPTSDWKRPRVGRPAPIVAKTDVAALALERVNAVRKKLGRRPLAMSREQSDVATELAPYYFASVFGRGSPQARDDIVLGLMAGWHVDGLVQDGSFTSSWVTGTTDLDELIAAALRYPGGRRALLDPNAERLAVGTIVNDDGRFLAAIFGTYWLFDDASHDETAGKVLEALDAARKAAGKPPVRHLVDVAGLSRLSAQRVQGGEEPMDVLRDLMQQSTQLLSRSVNGWVLTSSDPEQIEFPAALLQRDTIEIAIGVSHHKPDDQPWAQYVILVVAAEPRGRGA